MVELVLVLVGDSNLHLRVTLCVSLCFRRLSTPLDCWGRWRTEDTRTSCQEQDLCTGLHWAALPDNCTLWPLWILRQFLFLVLKYLYFFKNIKLDVNYTSTGAGLSEVGTNDCEDSQVEEEEGQRDVVLELGLNMYNLLWPVGSHLNIRPVIEEKDIEILETAASRQNQPGHQHAGAL